MIGSALPQCFPTLCQIVIVGCLTVAACYQRELQTLVRNIAQGSPWHQEPSAVHRLSPC